MVDGEDNHGPGVMDHVATHFHASGFEDMIGTHPENWSAIDRA
jgi:hypothetical protein